MIAAAPEGNRRAMSTEDAAAVDVRGEWSPPEERLSTDEQLGSPVLSFEEGWLIGLALGSLTILFIARRRNHRARRVAEV
jgi:hypothetical protein